MASNDTYSYIDIKQETEGKHSVGNENRYVDDQRSGNAALYEIPVDQDKHIYLDLNSRPDSEATNQDKINPNIDAAKTGNCDPSHNAGGRCMFVVIIVIIVVLLVAMVATSAVMYFGGSEESSGRPEFKTSAEKTQEYSTPEAKTSSRTTTTPLTTTESIRDRCRVYDGLVPHPRQCQVYYDCSIPFGDKDPTWFDFPHLSPMKECLFPKLFSPWTLACEHFEYVTCGERTEPKHYCQYHQSQSCYRSHMCVPCSEAFSYGTCVGKEDGFNIMDDDKPWSSSFLVCYKERIIKVMECPDEPKFGKQYFSPEYKGCVSLDRIPPIRGGMKPDCTGKRDGFYPNEHKKCNFYTECYMEQYKELKMCPGSYMFDEVTKSCSESPTSLCICNSTGC